MHADLCGRVGASSPSVLLSSPTLCQVAKGNCARLNSNSSHSHPPRSLRGRLRSHSRQPAVRRLRRQHVLSRRQRDHTQAALPGLVRTRLSPRAQYVAMPPPSARPLDCAPKHRIAVPWPTHRSPAGQTTGGKTGASSCGERTACKLHCSNHTLCVAASRMSHTVHKRKHGSARASPCKSATPYSHAPCHTPT